MPVLDGNFEAFVTNLGKYNEGMLVGEWVKLPTTEEEMQKVFERIGIGKQDDFGQPYEEWFITDYECPMEDDYGMIDGIINNGPKEDKTLDAKAPETREKSSIMDRLKAAKGVKQKECTDFSCPCSPACTPVAAWSPCHTLPRYYNTVPVKPQTI